MNNNEVVQVFERETCTTSYMSKRTVRFLVPAFLPGVEVGCLHADACGISVTGENRSGFGQGEQLRLDGVNNGVEVAVGTPSRSGTALEESIA